MRKLSSEENTKLAESLSIYYIETSSKTGNNVDNLFYKIVTEYQVMLSIFFYSTQPEI